MKITNYRKLTGLIVILILLFICIFVSLSINRLINNRDFVIQSQTNKLETVNRLAASSMSDYFGKIKLSLKAADFWLVNHKNADPRFDKEFIALVNLLKLDMSGNVDIRLVSKKGELYYIPSTSKKALADVHDREYYTVQQNSKTKGFFIADPVQSRVTKKWGIPISFPLKSENYGISIIFAAIELPTLEKIFESYQMKQNGSIMLVSEDGTVLSTTPFNKNLLGKSLIKYKFWNDLVKKNGNHPEIYETKEINGADRYITSQKVNQFPIYVISSCAKTSVLEPWAQTLDMNILFIVLPIIVLVLLGIIMIRILKRLETVLHDIIIVSNTDHLTGLHNRRYFIEQLKMEILSAERYNHTFSLVEMDIDKFKAVNDTFGHETGDILLQSLAKLLTENIRATDVVARWGGEEFVLLLKNADLDNAYSCIEKLRKIIETTEFKAIGHITGSFGVVEYQPGEEYDALLSRVDKLLYISKNTGRNRISK